MLKHLTARSEGGVDHSALSSPSATPSSNDVVVVSIKELLEKNLKWSQIIYEQNRRINNKLLWMALSSWIRVFLIIIPLVAAILYAPRLYRKLSDQYSFLLQGVTSGNKTNAASVDNLLKMLPLSEPQREQLKTILK